MVIYLDMPDDQRTLEVEPVIAGRNDNNPDATGDIIVGPIGIPSEAWRYLEVNEFIDALSDEIQTVRLNWQNVNRLKTDAQRPEFVRQMAERNDEIGYGTAPPTNRSEARNRKSSGRLTAYFIQKAITEAQFCATVMHLGIEDQKEVARKMISEREEAHDSPSTYQYPIDVFTIELFGHTFNSYVEAVRAEDDLLQKLTDWLAARPAHIFKLADWLQSEKCDAEGEHKPLLEALARLYFHPNITSFLHEILERAASQPSLFQEEIVKQMGAQTAEDYTGEVGAHAEWLKFIPLLMAKAGVEVDLSKIIDHLKEIDYDSLPPSIKLAVEEEARSVTEKVHQVFSQTLTPYVRADRFYVFEPPDSQPPHAATKAKAKNKSNGRSTRRRNQAVAAVSKVMEIEPEEKITTAYVASKTPNGYIITDLKGDEPKEQILGSKMVGDILRYYVSDPTFKTDLEQMLHSILKTPRGDGCTKMKVRELTFRFPLQPDSQRKTLAVWHLNPKQRSTLTNLGETAKQMRIDYALLSNGDGTESIILISIRNKSDTRLELGKS